MTDEVLQQTATPAEVEQTEQVQSDAAASTESSTEQTQQQQEETQKEEAQKKEPWFQKRINEQTRKFYEAQREAMELKQRLAQYEQQNASQEDSQQTPDINRLVEERAAQVLQQRQLSDAVNRVYAEGAKEFPDFDAAIGTLQLAGASKQFIELAVTSDAGAKLIHHLGQMDNIAETERILSLPPVLMARELTKLEMKLSQPTIKPVSKAPAPIKPIGAGGSTDSGLRDDLPIEEWMRRDRASKRSR